MSPICFECMEEREHPWCHECGEPTDDMPLCDECGEETDTFSNTCSECMGE